MRRLLDISIVSFFVVNLLFITYIVDIEQLIIVDPNNFVQPIWPPRVLLDVIHWWAKNFDPLQGARPVWWRATIWIDVLGFGPYYAAAIYAFIKRKNWIRMPSIIWASVMMTNVTIIMFEEMIGPHASPRPGIVWLANISWLIFPLLTMIRMWNERPFTEEKS